MIHCPAKSASALRLLAVCIALLACSACSNALIDRAIRARGGALESLERQVDATVYKEFPGEWTWEMAYREPDLFRWTLQVAGEDQSYVYDGSKVTLFLGSAALPVDPASAASFRSQARFIALTLLDDVAHETAAQLSETPAAELPKGAARGLRIRFPTDGTSYDLFFDASDLLVAASGPVSMPPVGAGTLRAEYGDFRAVGGYTFPFRVRYTLNGEPLAEERVKQLVPNNPDLTPASFSTGG
jgi:outer membrane lipoprotein-sorting protein